MIQGIINLSGTVSPTGCRCLRHRRRKMMALYGEYAKTTEGMKRETVMLMFDTMKMDMEQIMREKPGAEMVAAHIIIHPDTIEWKLEMKEPGNDG